MGELLNAIKENLSGSVSNWEERYGRRHYCDVEPERIVGVARLLFERYGLRLSTASGIDARECIEILYHFSLDREGAVISLRVRLPKERPEIDSLTAVMEAADWIEKEICEMLGVTFRGHPDMRHLLLADDWPEGKYPLRRDSEGL